MKKRILLTSFGGGVSFEFIEDFKRRDFDVFYADCNPASKLPLLTKNFFPVPPGSTPHYSETMLEICKKYRIDMLIPGSDEEAFALMKTQSQFRQNSIIPAVQEESYLAPFSSKSAMYAYLAKKGLSVPAYHVVISEADLKSGAEKLGYGETPLIIKPDSGRGGRGIYMLSEKPMTHKENWPVMTLEEFSSKKQCRAQWILMAYIDGMVIDVDVLTYPSNTVTFGYRKRFTNVTKNFSGNEFVFNKDLEQFSKQVFTCFPTQFLIDYDIYENKNGSYELLEINPRPSGSTVSYLPYGVNAYALLAEGYFLNKEEVFPRLQDQSSHVFYKIVKG